MWTWNSDPFGTDAANPNPAGAGTFPYNLRFPGPVVDGQAGLQQNYMEILTQQLENMWKAIQSG